MLSYGPFSEKTSGLIGRTREAREAGREASAWSKNGGRTASSADQVRRNARKSSRAADRWEQAVNKGNVGGQNRETVDGRGSLRGVTTQPLKGLKGD